MKWIKPVIETVRVQVPVLFSNALVTILIVSEPGGVSLGAERSSACSPLAGVSLATVPGHHPWPPLAAGPGWGCGERPGGERVPGWGWQDQALGLQICALYIKEAKSRKHLPEWAQSYKDIKLLTAE